MKGLSEYKYLFEALTETPPLTTCNMTASKVSTLLALKLYHKKVLLL